MSGPHLGFRTAPSIGGTPGPIYDVWEGITFPSNPLRYLRFADGVFMGFEPDGLQNIVSTWTSPTGEQDTWTEHVGNPLAGMHWDGDDRAWGAGCSRVSGKFMLGARDNTVAVTDDQGATWTEVNTGMDADFLGDHLNDWFGSCESPTVIVLNGDSGQYSTSTDGGVTWTGRRNSATLNNGTGAVSGFAAGYFWQSGQKTGPIDALWRSTDGVTWTEVTWPAPAAAQIMYAGKLPASRVVLVQYMSTAGVNEWSAYSDDFGATWTDTPNNVSYTNQIGTFIMAKGKMLCGRHGQNIPIVWTDDGVTWHQGPALPGGIVSASHGEIAFDGHDTVAIAAGTGIDPIFLLSLSTLV